MRKQLTSGLWLTVFLTIWCLTSFAQTPTTPVVPIPGTPAAGPPTSDNPANRAPATGTPTDTAVKPRVLKSVFGTVATDSVPVSPNSSKQKAGVPTTNADSVRVGDSSLTAGGDSLQQGTDTTQLSEKQNAEIRKIIPRKATIRSLMFPGLGQAYNRQYYKIPFVYAGFAVVVYDIIKFTGNYNEYLAGYSEAFNLPELAAGQTTYANGLTFRGAIVRGETRDLSYLKRNSEFWRRNRDFNIILGVLLWGLQAVEANVAAHLKTFDISDNISATWKPTLLPSSAGVVPGVRLTFNFDH